MYDFEFSLNMRSGGSFLLLMIGKDFRKRSQNQTGKSRMSPAPAVPLLRVCFEGHSAAK